MKISTKTPFYLLWAGAFLLPACQRSDEKEILQFQVYGAPFLYPPKVEITDDLVLVNVDQTLNLKNLHYALKVSPDATIVDQPENLSKPANIVVKAQDGTTKTHSVIASQVHAMMIDWDLFMSDLAELYRCTGARWKPEGIGAYIANDGLDIQFDHCDLLTDNEYLLGIFIRNKKPGDPLEGSYFMGSDGPGTASARWFRKIYSSAIEKYYFPFGGSLEITEYDEIHQTVSGSFEGLSFGAGGPAYWLSGAFDNVRIVD